MRTILCLTALIGCTDGPADEAPPAAPPAVAPAATPEAAASPQGKRTDPSRGKRLGRGSKEGKGRTTGDTPRTLPDALSDADRDARMIARCSDGHVVFSFWQGEYPSPAVQLDRPLRTRVLSDPCGGPRTIGCTAPAGLYHPWASPEDKPEGLVFGVRTQPTTYVLRTDHSIAGRALKQGTEVELLTRLSEGFCTMAADGQILEDRCPSDAADDPTWQRTGANLGPEVQMIQLTCGGGSQGWLVIDEAFLKQSGVREGQIQGYGDVARTP